MTVDVSKLIDGLPAARREAALRVGAQFASSDTLRQADQTLLGWARYGDEVGQFGYSSDDAAELTALRDELATASADRQGARAGNKTTSQVLAQAMADGKTARLRAQSVLSRAEGLVADAAAQKIAAVLSQTRSAGADAQRLLDQLKILQPLLADKDIGAVVKKRGGPEAASAIKQAVATLTEAQKARPGITGTPAETAQMDLLDGLIAENVRDARRAARAAARTLGRPEVADAFELTGLYAGHGRQRKSAPPPTPGNPTG